MVVTPFVSSRSLMEMGIAVEGAEVVAPLDCFVGSAGIGEGLVGAQGEVGAEPGVQLVDALVEQLGEFDG